MVYEKHFRIFVDRIFYSVEHIRNGDEEDVVVVDALGKIYVTIALNHQTKTGFVYFFLEDGTYNLHDYKYRENVNARNVARQATFLHPNSP